jgi:hypothetical protein
MHLTFHNTAIMNGAHEPMSDYLQKFYQGDIDVDKMKRGLDAAYKQQKEAFVSNLNGTSLWEINNVTLVAPVRHLIRLSILR